MTQAQPRFTTFEAYLSYSDDLEGRYELIAEALVKLPPESRLNSTIAFALALSLTQLGIAVKLIHPGKCEIQVPILAASDAANRYPDLVVLGEEHLELTQRRLTITLEMPPPQLVVEVVSPGRTNRDRDYIHKRAQYAAVGVPEYWLIDPSAQTVLVLQLQGDHYSELGVFCGDDRINSSIFPTLSLQAKQIFQE